MGLFCIASSCLLRVVLHGRLEFLGFLTKPGIFVSADKKKKKNPEVCNSFLIWAKKKEFCIPWAKSSLHYCANIERKWLASKFIAPASKLCIFSELLLTT